MKSISEIALSYLGAKQGEKKHLEILKIYNSNKPLPRGYAVKPTDPWCAAFVSAAAVMAGTAERYPLECSCSRMIEGAKKMVQNVLDALNGRRTDGLVEPEEDD